MSAFISSEAIQLFSDEINDSSMQSRLGCESDPVRASEG